MTPNTPPLPDGFTRTAVLGAGGLISDSWWRFLNAYLRPTAVYVVQVPASSSATGSVNQVAIDANYLYVCIGQNSWKRIALTAF